VIFRGADLALNLASEVPLEGGPANGAFVRFTLEAGESASFVLHQLEGDEGPRETLKRAECQQLLQRTLDYWRRWVSKSTYEGRWREMVNRSVLALKLMVYDPTGALVAAPTMGLPEAMGWLQDRCQGSGGLLQPLYGIDGREELHEVELPHLSGYRDTRPVRIGNGAYDELQLDLYGAVLDAAYLHNRYGAPLNYDVWQSLRTILNWLSENWRQPDAGMWGARGDRRHFVSSKVFSWVAFHRAVLLAYQRGLPAEEGRWIAQQDAIYEEIMERGWNPQKGSFVQHYGSDALDASLLLMPLMKFVGPTDPRWLATLERIQKELAYDTLVDRYRVAEAAPDGLSGEEGSFSMCSFWLVECLTQAGRLEEARLALEKMFSHANHLGLYAEEIGPSGEALGNFPQAFTHLSLITAAVRLDRALG
jgi:GH15 family glucan-1,4-alpha-glucosidase